MIILKGKKELSSITYQSRAISVVYLLGKKIWEAVRSCFGAGYWDNDKPWDNDEAWKN